MSAKLRQCRQGLAAALVRATNEVPDVECCSLMSPNISGPVLSVSSSFPNDHPENPHDCSVCLASHNHIPRHLAERPDFTCIGQGSGHTKEDFFHSWTEAELLHDLPGTLETSSLQTLEELVAKLEFENELNQERNRLMLTADIWPIGSPARVDATGGGSSRAEERTAEGHPCVEDDEHSRLLDTVLEMEQDYNLSVY